MDSVYLLGLDIGTSAVKLAAYDENGRRILLLREPLDILTRPGFSNWFEQDPFEIYAKTLQLLKRTVKTLGKGVYLVGLSSTSPGLLLLDSAGRPLGNHILWMDRRAVFEAQEVASKLGEDEVYRRTGLGIDAIFTAVKILWIKRNRPELFNRASYFVQLKDYVFYRLTGEKYTDYSHVSETLLYELRGQWFHEMLELLGLTQDNFFTPRNSTSIYRVSEETRKELDVQGEVYVALGGVDSVCAALGAGGIDSSVLVDTTGTSTCLDLAVDEPVVTEHRVFETYFHVIPGKYVLEACIPTSGEALRKMLELIGDEGGDPDRYIEKSGPEPTGILLLPFLSGSRSPDWDPELKGAIYGLTLSTAKHDLVKAVLEGVAYWERRIIEEIEKLGFKISEVRLVGGGASQHWAKIKANVTGKRQAIPAEREASAFGAALLAGLGYGLYKDIGELSKIIRIEAVMDPDREIQAKYDAFYNKYVQLWSMVKSIK